MRDTDDPRIYAALAMPNAAIEEGGVEILRVGIIADELHVGARRAFKDPKQWGEVLAEIAQRIAKVYAAETKRSEQDVVEAIRDGFVAELGAPAPTSRRRPAKKKTVKRSMVSARKAKRR
jgi:Domain of unknown function (DUF5076)